MAMMPTLLTALEWLLAANQIPVEDALPELTLAMGLASSVGGLMIVWLARRRHREHHEFLRRQATIDRLTRI